MLNFQTDIRSITEFKRNSAPILARVTKEKAPAILTLNGNSSVVVLDVGTYQELIENLEYVKTLKTVEDRITKLQNGEKTVPVKTVLAEMESMLNNG